MASEIDGLVSLHPEERDNEFSDFECDVSCDTQDIDRDIIEANLKSFGVNKLSRVKQNNLKAVMETSNSDFDPNDFEAAWEAATTSASDEHPANDTAKGASTSTSGKHQTSVISPPATPKTKKRKITSELEIGKYSVTIKQLTNRAIVPRRPSPLSSLYELFSAEDVTIYSCRYAQVSTDLKILLPTGLIARIEPKFLITSRGLQLISCVIDSQFRRNVRVIVHNHNQHRVMRVLKGQPIGYLVFLQTLFPNISN